MEYELWVLGLVTISTIATAIWGILNFKKKMPLFFRLVIYGIGCLGLGRLFEFVMDYLYGYVPTDFHVGLLAVIGGFAFFFSSFYGQLDGLIDEGEAKYKKYRIIPFAAPIFLFIIWLTMFITPGNGNSWLTLSVCVFVYPASYFALKYFIYPDNGSGMADSIRKYSLSLLLLTVVCCIEQVCLQQDWIIVWCISALVECAIYPVMLVTLRKGCLSWTT